MDHQHDIPGGQQERQNIAGGRFRKGNFHRKRMKVYENPHKLAFRGWATVAGMWTAETCARYVEWCHINKVFLPERYHINRRGNKANLRYCTDPQFTQRCIEVYQVLFNEALVKRNEVPLFICRMVWVELKLGKSVDWSSIKSTPRVIIPHDPVIPRGVLKFPGGGLVNTDAAPRTREEPYHSDDSPYTSDSDGGPPVFDQHQVGSISAKRVRKRNRQAPLPIEHVSVARQLLPPEVDAQPLPTEAGPVAPEMVSQARVQEIIMEWTAKVAEKDYVVERMREEMEILRTELQFKNQRLVEQGEEVHRLQQKVLDFENAQVQERVGIDVRGHGQEGGLLMDHDALENVIAGVTIGVIEPDNVPRGRQPTSNVRPPPQVQTQDSQDSLSFPTPTQGGSLWAPPPMDVERTRRLERQVVEMRSRNAELRGRLNALVAQHCQWKLACIMTVDRNRQMAEEFSRIDNEYTRHNSKRDFGLTSWAHTDEMFPWSRTPMVDVEGNDSIIDWKLCGWDYENAMSSHHHRGGTSVKLWPRPSSFVLDGTECAVCLNAFGPEGGFHLGTCEHIFHPMCLISLMLCRRRCAVCKAPFHERLYDLFGLVPYMPVSWECDPVNTPDYPNKWGDDLVWSWRLNSHSVYKSELSSQFGWETDYKEITRVCHRLISRGEERSQGKRNFFFQCFNGYWDERANRFQFGVHPRGWMWNERGERITDDNGQATMDVRNALQLSLSEWMERFRGDAVDFLLEQHSQETTRALRQMRDSDFMRTILETDGPARRTRSRTRKRLVIGESDDEDEQEHQRRRNNNGAGSSGAGPSGTSHEPIEM